MDNTGVYRLVNAQSEKSYVGSAVDIKHRTRSHFKALAAGTHYNPKLQAAYNTYGAFRCIVLERCSREVLYEREQYWIDRLDVVNNGYNICPKAGAASWLGRKRPPFTPDWCAKLSEVAKRPRPNGSVSIQRSWAGRRAKRVTLQCVDCKKTKRCTVYQASQYKEPYRCRVCYLVTYRRLRKNNYEQ